jgi:hypothetical protein
MVISDREILGEELRRACRLVVRHGIARAGHPDDDVIVLNLDQKTPAQHFSSPAESLTAPRGVEFPASALPCSLKLLPNVREMQTKIG